MEKLLGHFQQRCDELEEQLKHWRAELAIAREARIVERTIRCERVIGVCEKVIADLKHAAHGSSSNSNDDDQKFFFDRPE